MNDFNDSHPAPGITLRRWTDSRRIDLYEGGWRTGTYATERGAELAVNRIKACEGQGS